MATKWQQHASLAVLDEFLVAQEWARLLQYTLKRRRDFAKSGVLDAGGGSRTDNSYRRSQVLYDLGDCQTMFVDRIMTFLPHALARLRQPPFPISHFEVQLTATNDGQFFRKHTDNDSGSVRTRTLTFVYYFFREPKSFRGGALRLYDTQLDERGKVKAGSFQTVHPMQNQIVFFPSDCLHEVLPVKCPSRRFEDSRFTINGWIHQ
jgi:Rps23 Pro-64 3,4-dihydroxylase Tpa1-like proline 4-hydroxylase